MRLTTNGGEERTTRDMRQAGEQKRLQFFPLRSTMKTGHLSNCHQKSEHRDARQPICKRENWRGGVVLDAPWCIQEYSKHDFPLFALGDRQKDARAKGA